MEGMEGLHCHGSMVFSCGVDCRLGSFTMGVKNDRSWEAQLSVLSGTLLHPFVHQFNGLYLMVFQEVSVDEVHGGILCA